MTQRKMFKIKMMLLLAAALLIGSTMHAQVTIGSGEAPISGSLLQLKDKSNAPIGASNARKGVALPRVELTEKDQLFPMFESNGAGGYKVSYVKADEDKKHIGLFVYNLTEDEDKDLYPGLYQWDGKEWKSFEIKMENAQFAQLACDDIIVNGTYIEGTVVTAANYLTVNLDVTRVGAYSFSITSGNGYSFYLSGVALAAGPMIVNVPCQGKPVKPQTDNLTISGIDVVGGCQPEVEVVSSIAEYTLNCSSIAVKGIYKKGTPLTPTLNTIDINVMASTSGSYTITTPLTNGIQFSASGKITLAKEGETEIFTITLKGSGKPTVNFDFPVTIQANTLQGSATCSATVPVTLPPMTYAIIGDGEYSWITQARTDALSKASSNGSFGPTGKVKIQEFKLAWQTTNVAIAASNLNSNSTAKPDIVLYFSYGASPNDALISALANYIKKGGCVIYGSRDNEVGEANNLMNGIFGIKPAIAQSGGASDDDVYPIANLPNDPIINGPFGNLAFRYWGEDNGSSGSVIMTTLPPNSVQICSARSASKTSRNSDHSIVWYNDFYNFVYFGDSTGASQSNNDAGAYPTRYDSSGLPLSKNYGPSGYQQFVYNSALELNAVAYLIKKAAASGINKH
ncbi:hypothetical protein FACS189426_08900 [Bacteroidia bacterium]|nr:hypothetical protein FACS189426_08900 [Bacteroidia bacterium]